MPVGFRQLGDGGTRLEVVSHHLLERLREAGVAQAFFVLREGKWDIPAYYRDGGAVGLELAYLLAKSDRGVPFTLDSAYAFAQHQNVAMGFPDILYPEGVFVRALERLRRGDAEVVLGLFPALHPERSDMVATDEAGQLLDIHIKPARTALTLSWGMAVWSARFSDFLHAWVGKAWNPGAEAQLGHVFLAARDAGLRLACLAFDAPFLDIGTPEGYRRAWREREG